jgi:hypothetical protein
LRKLINALTEALQNDNTAAIRALGREHNQTAEELTFLLFEAAGLIYASGKEPRSSEIYKALLTLGRELDSEAIAWSIQERTRRAEIAAAREDRKSWMR